MRAMSATPDALRLPPLAEPQFDIGAEDNLIPLLTELFARHGDIYRFHSPGRREDMWVINHPDDVKRVALPALPSSASVAARAPSVASCSCGVRRATAARPASSPPSSASPGRCRPGRLTPVT